MPLGRDPWPREPDIPDQVIPDIQIKTAAHTTAPSFTVMYSPTIAVQEATADGAHGVITD